MTSEYVLGCISDHDAASNVEIVIGCSLENHAGVGLATLTDLAVLVNCSIRVVWAEVEGIYVRMVAGKPFVQQTMEI